MVRTLKCTSSYKWNNFSQKHETSHTRHIRKGILRSDTISWHASGIRTVVWGQIPSGGDWSPCFEQVRRANKPRWSSTVISWPLFSGCLLGYIQVPCFTSQGIFTLQTLTLLHRSYSPLLNVYGHWSVLSYNDGKESIPFSNHNSLFK